MNLPSIAAHELDDAALRDRLIELEQIRNQAEAQQASVMVEMHHRAEAEDAARDAALSPAARTLTPDHGGQLIEFVGDEIAVLLTCTRMAATHRLDTALDAATLPAVVKAWNSGAIDARKTSVITGGLRDVDPAFVDTLAGQATDYATSHTAPQTRSWLARRVLSADPAMAEIRRSRAIEGRHVTLTPLADGMAELTARLPGVQARRAYDAINALARSTRPGPGAEAARTSIRTADQRTADQLRADALIDLLTGHADPPQVTVQVVVPADTLAGDSDGPGEIAGLGPITGHATRTLIAASKHVTYRTLVADPDTGTLIDRPASLVDPPASTDPDAVPGTDRYRPSAALSRDIRQRDHTCRFPGCRRPSGTTTSGTDLDHVIPWPAGATSWGNLVVLCRHHHRLKHSAGWRALLDRDGVLTWSTPTGRTITTHPWHYLDPPDTS
ncbi:MAG: DUF222 domain-containing protein [Actinomycetes bacterium]